MQKSLFWSKFLIHCEAHCQKFENTNHYISKTVLDILLIPTDLSSGGQKLCSIKKCHHMTVHC